LGFRRPWRDGMLQDARRKPYMSGTEPGGERQGHVQSLERSSSAYAEHGGGRGWAKANYAGGVIARTLPAGRKTEASSWGRWLGWGGCGGPGGNWGEGSRAERSWGRFGVRGWLHTKEQAAGRRFNAESQSPRQPGDKRAGEAAVGARRKRLPLPQPRPPRRGEGEREPPAIRDGRTDPPPDRPTLPG